MFPCGVEFVPVRRAEPGEPPRLDDSPATCLGGVDRQDVAPGVAWIRDAGADASMRVDPCRGGARLAQGWAAEETTGSAFSDGNRGRGEVNSKRRVQEGAFVLLPVIENGPVERLLAVTEEELQRIVLDVHDGPVQHLYAALSQLSSLRRHRASPGRMSRSELVMLDCVITLLESSLKEIRNLLSTLRAPGFAERRLEDLLEGAVVEHEALGGGRVSLAMTITRDVVLPLKLCLFRVLQEALSNVRRHAGVQEARVSLHEDHERLVLTIADQGRGFDPPPLTGPYATDRPEHIGLRGMRERAAFMGGTLVVESSPGHGTRVRVEVPVRG